MDEPELNLSQIAERAELDSGTAFRLVKTLVMLGYLRQVENTKRYYLGLKVLDLGFNAISRMDLHASARPNLAGAGGTTERGGQHRGPRQQPRGLHRASAGRTGAPGGQRSPRLADSGLLHRTWAQHLGVFAV